MNYKKLAAALAVFLVAAVAGLNLYTALLFIGIVLSLLPMHWPKVVSFWRDSRGTATVSYVWPVPAGSTGPSTTPPTTALAALVNEVTALVQWIDADTIATITHNFQFPVTFTFPYPNAAQFKPQVFHEYISYVTGAPAAIFVGSFTSNTIVFQKTSLASTAGTVLVTMRRPWQASQ